MNNKLLVYWQESHLKNYLTNSKLIRSTLIYTSSNIAVAIVPFILLPIMTKYLSTSDYGTIANFFLLVSFTGCFVGVNVHGAIMVAYYEKDTVDLPLYIKNCFYIIIVSVLVVGAAYWGFGNYISKYTTIPFSWLWTIIVISSIQMLIAINLNLWRINSKAFKYSAFQVTQTLITLGLAVWFVVFLGKGWQGRVGATFITILIYGIISIFFLYKEGWLKGKYSINKEYFKGAFLFGLFLIPHGLGLIILQLADRLFITNMVGISETGIYSVGSQVGMAITLITNSFLLAFQPWLYEKLSEGNPDSYKKIVVMTYMFVIGTVIIAVILGISAPIIISIFVDTKFSGSYQYVLWLGLGYGFYAIYSLFINFIAYTKKTRIISMITIFACVVNITLNYFLIQRFGAIGAAYATCFAYLCMVVLAIKYVLREFNDISWFPFIKQVS